MEEIEKLQNIKRLEIETWKNSKKSEAIWLEIIDTLENIVKDNSTNIIALTNLGAAYSNFGKYNAALKLLESARDLDFEDKNLYFNIGVVLVNLQRFDEAKNYFKLSKTKKVNELTFEAYIDFQAL